MFWVLYRGPSGLGIYQLFNLQNLNEERQLPVAAAKKRWNQQDHEP